MNFEVGKSLLYLSRSNAENLGLNPIQIVSEIGDCVKETRLGGTVLAATNKVAIEDGAQFISKGGYIRNSREVALKWFGSFRGNAALGLREYHPMVLLNESDHGFPIAVMDGTWISEFRTAAISAYAATKLARPDSNSIGFVACGAQAHAHLIIFKDIFPLRTVYAYSRTRDTTLAFCRFAEQLGLEAIAAPNARDVVESAEIIVTSVPYVSNTTPILEGGWIQPGGFASMVDRGFSWKTDTLTSLDRLFTDDLNLSGEGGPEKLNCDPRLLSGDLTDLHSRQNESYRERTALIFSGSGLFDVALASLVFRVARSRGMGTILPL
ncbi:MAG: ornithine cyclodeaminase family protein [Rhizobiaceae bacterium]|nr:ornithine cyclodeaminase family protein [Rhizobiaceae bacterium]